jgi:hypothetical protein
MDRSIITRKRRQLALRFALFGLAVAAAFGGYFETSPRLESPAALFAGSASLVLCPGSLLFVTFVDAEPQTSGFLFMWLVVGLINFALYGAVGMVVGKFRWKTDAEPPTETAGAGD